MMRRRSEGFRRVGAWCGLAAVVLAVVVPLVGGARRAGYSHVSQYISELGERGAPDGRWVSLGGFLPIAVLVAVFATVAAMTHRRVRLLAAGLLCLLAVSLGYGVASVARCDPGCPEDGTTTQTVHNGAGLVEYLVAGAGLGLVVRGAYREGGRLRRRVGRPAVWAAVAYVAVLGVSLAPSGNGTRGLAQRLLEVVLFGVVALVSVDLLRSEPERPLEG